MKKNKKHSGTQNSGIITKKPRCEKSDHLYNRPIIVFGEIRLGEFVTVVSSSNETDDTRISGEIVFIHPRRRYFIVQGPYRESFLMPPALRNGG